MSRNSGVMIQSVARALEILECFDDSTEVLGISEIAERMNLSKSTVFGLVSTLHKKGYLEQDVVDKRYKLGIRLFELGHLYSLRLNIINEAMPYCEKLSQKYNATVHIGTRDGNEIIYIAKVNRPDSFVVFSQVGKRAPLYCTGVGKGILAFLDEQEIRDYAYQTKYIKYTDNTISNATALINELEKIRINGYSTDSEEIVPGLRCVSAPIFDRNKKPIAAISLSMIGNAMNDESVEIISKELMSVTNQISRRLGYQT